MVCPGRPSRPNSVVVLLLVPVRCCKRDFHTRGGSRQRASGRAGIIIRRRRPPQQQQQQNKAEMDGDRDQPIFLAAGGDTTGSVSTARRLCPRGRRVRTNFSTSRKSPSTRPPRETLRRETSRFWTISKKRIETAPAAAAAFTTTHNSLLPGYPRVMRLQGKKRCAKRAMKNMKRWMATVRAPHSTTTGQLILSPPPPPVSRPSSPLPPSRPGPPTPGGAEI